MESLRTLLMPSSVLLLQDLSNYCAVTLNTLAVDLMLNRLPWHRAQKVMINLGTVLKRSN